MSYSALDRIQMASTSTGTSNLTLTAVSGTAYRSFSQLSVGSNFDYAIINDAASDEWEIGQGTFDSATNTLVRVRVHESSNIGNPNINIDSPFDFVNFSAGNKNVFLAFPANIVTGGLVAGDDGSIKSINRSSVLRMLERRRARGSVFSNVIFSTYSIIVSATQQWSGGVLAPNGDIHYVPDGSTRGQKVNAYTGVVSTYSLVLTGQGGQATFAGGVLSPNGDIHFVPWFNSNGRGQKVSTGTGIVSTYSLIYTGLAIYNSGLLDRNGNVVFTPYGNFDGIGQRISPVGVVSTFSYPPSPNTTGRLAGVLAPNGDIYYLPNSNAVMLRIRSSGSHVTYSTPIQYISGGCLGVDGQIYAFESGSTTYMKIDPVTAVMTTYTKPFAGTHRGALLAGDGYMYLLPTGVDSYGERMSPNGIFSTYSMIAPGSVYFRSGVLAPNGDIHLIPRIGTVAGKITTGCPIPLGEALSSIFVSSGVRTA